MRPSTVTRAIGLLRTIGLAYLLGAVALLGGAGAVPGRVRAEIAEAGVDPRAYEVVKGLAGSLPIGAALFTAVIGFVFLLTGRLIAGGRPGVHIAGLVLCGLAVVLGLATVAFAGTPVPAGWFSITAWSSGPDGMHVFASRLTDLYAPGFQIAILILGVIGVIAAAGAFGLLLGQASRAYFRVAPAVPVAVGPPMLVPQPRAVPSAPGPELAAALNVLRRKRERGELSDEDYAQARDRLLRDGGAA